MSLALVREEGAPDALAILAAQVAANRFMPVPPPELAAVGDGDFRAIGAEFLTHFVRLGGLAPGDAVLDIGSGIGRMALPLTQYLDAGGRYDGLDPVESGIAWCRKAITPRYGRFSFQHLDVRNELYNPGGKIACQDVRLPFPDGGHDFVIMTSVLTHLRTAEAAAYAGEVARVLRPGGRCFATLFLMDEAARAGLRSGPRRLPFDPDGAGPEFLADPEVPPSAVAFDHAFLVGLFAGKGLALARPVVRGHWSGAAPPAGPYQDICVFTRKA